MTEAMSNKSAKYPTASKPVETASSGVEESLRIVIVEDNPSDAFFLQSLLSAAGFTQPVQHAACLAELEELAVACDLLLLDLHLPDSGGIETLQRARSLCPKVPIIILSGQDDLELARACIEAGAQDYLGKGAIDPLQLRRSIAYAFSRRREAELQRMGERLRRAELLQRLTDASVLVVTAATFARMLQLSAGAARRAFGAGLAVVEFRSEDGEEHRAVSTARAPAQRVPDVLRVQLHSTDGPCLGTREQLAAVGHRSWLAVPLLRNDGSQVGGIHLFDKLTGPFDAEDTALLEQLARLVSVNLQLHRTHEILQATSHSLEEANKELGSLIFGASHDLTAPLRGLGHLVCFVEEDLAAGETESVAEHLTLMRGRLRRMQELLNDLREYAALSTRRPQTAGSDGDELLRAMRRGSFISGPFELVLPDSLPRVDCEPGLLLRLLGICMQNAVKHHDREQGRVELLVSAGKDELILEVRDDGPGIPPRFHQRVFEMFQTLRPRDTVEGSGMGLALARKIVDLVGGSIAIESDGGRGTCVRIAWPKPRAGVGSSA